MELIYRDLSRDEIIKMKEIDRKELVEYNYRVKDGKLEMFEFYCDIKGFGAEHLNRIIDDLYKLYDNGGTIYGAFENSKLVGIVSLDSKFRGRNKDRLQLALLHVSNDYRKKGIGKYLVEIVKEKAKQLGASKIYISGAPIKNTIDFYMNVGCKLTPEIDEELYKLEPDDIPMELCL
jgi:GNAT superfamily N-acetyltransferase